MSASPPADTSLVTLVQVAGCRWRVEEAFEQAKAKSVSITTGSANIRPDAGYHPGHGGAGVPGRDPRPPSR
jgi:hypothetical protein